MKMRFTKMHGLGNDYVVLGFRESPDLSLLCEGESEPINLGFDFGGLSVKLCDRHFGVGADGLIAVLPSKTADLRMRIFNIDGSEAEMCGNGIRCAVRYYIENLMPSDSTPPGDEDIALRVETGAGIKKVVAARGNGVVGMLTVNMGAPTLDPPLIPVSALSVRAIDIPVETPMGVFYATCVSMGNPHAVIFMDEDVNSVDVCGIGPAIETHKLFPRKTNVEFVNVISPSNLKMRVWERGVGETLACGTGACATLVAAHLTDRASRNAVLHLSGGDLHIEWAQSGEVMMTGPSVTVFTGKIDID